MIYKNWIQIALLLILAGLVKGGLHVVRVLLLAGLGLAGMWMLHTLAQDFDKISNRFMLGQISNPTRLGKRSIDSFKFEPDIPGFPELKWDVILKEDPEGCVPSFICQLAASPYAELKYPERNVLKLIRSSKVKHTKSSKIIRSALKLGESFKDSEKCRNRYISCPYTSDAILALLQTFGGKR